MTATTDITQAGTFRLGDRTVRRLGYGAMQLAGPGVFGPPKDREAAIAVLRAAVAAGVDHIDTSDFYGPHVTNQIIRAALHPYPDGLVIVTKVGAKRGADASWNPAFSAEELTRAVHDNLRNLGVNALDVVNLRLMFDVHGPAEGAIEAPLTVLADLQRQGLIRRIGLSNATPRQVAEVGAGSPRSSACRTSTTSPTAATTRSSTTLRLPARPTCRSFRWAGSIRSSRTAWRRWRPASARHRCRWRSPGCCAGRPTSC